MEIIDRVELLLRRFTRSQMLESEMKAAGEP